MENETVNHTSLPRNILLCSKFPTLPLLYSPPPSSPALPPVPWTNIHSLCNFTSHQHYFYSNFTNFMTTFIWFDCVKRFKDKLWKKKKVVQEKYKEIHFEREPVLPSQRSSLAQLRPQTFRILKQGKIMFGPGLRLKELFVKIMKKQILWLPDRK